nr:MAG TPA: hypothetical protein [Caudoviricetes sp.]
MTCKSFIFSPFSFRLKMGIKIPVKALDFYRAFRLYLNRQNPCGFGTRAIVVGRQT